MRNEFFYSILVGIVLSVLLLDRVSAQQIQPTESVTISGIIFDHQTGEVVPYATVYNKVTMTGTITDDKGYFKLNSVSRTDTVLVTFVGYNDLQIGSSSFGDSVFFISPKTELLNEFVVIADNTFLYHLVHRATKGTKSNKQIAKTYFSLESSVNNQQVEMLECYYNGEYANYNVNALKLKEGRIALKPFGNNYFISTETSKALYMHQLFEKNAYFPESPFELSKSNLKKKYELALNSKYENNDSSVVYVIDFTPKDSLIGLFEGRVWIDSVNAQIIKVNFKISNAQKHPFLPLPTVKTIEKVDLLISKTFKNLQGNMYVNSIDFNYQVSYSNSRGENVLVSTKALLFAYDYSSQFQLPFYTFTSAMYEDYQQINATPYNHFFWENIQEFGMSEIKEANDAYVENNASLTNQDEFFKNPNFDGGLFEFPYVVWSPKRIAFRKMGPDENTENSKSGGIPSEMYQLKAQIYCDINLLNDSLNIITSTVFDPHESYYYLEMNNYSVAFINMYFDLVEIHRREFLESVENKKTVEEVSKMYQVTAEKLKINSRQFFKEVAHGTNAKGMEKWNDLIIQKLNIDNLTLFRIYQ